MISLITGSYWKMLILQPAETTPVRAGAVNFPPHSFRVKLLPRNGGPNVGAFWGVGTLLEIWAYGCITTAIP